MALAVRIVLAVLPLGLCGCSYEAVWLGPEPPQVSGPPDPAPLTVGLRPGGFDRSRLKPGGVLARFREELRRAALFQGLMYPIPAGADPTWTLELSAADGAFEPDANFWKGALASALPPAALFVRLENDYKLRLEALMVRERLVVATYVGEATIRNRYGTYANRTLVDAAGTELAVGGASRQILAALSGDLDRLLDVDHN